MWKMVGFSEVMTLEKSRACSSTKNLKHSEQKSCVRKSKWGVRVFYYRKK